MIEVKPEHLHLDRAHLEEAALNQASVFDLYASECAKVQNKLDRQKNALEYRSAQLKIQIRQNADAAKVKMTQDQVDCALSVEPEVQQMKSEILDTEEYLGQLKAAVEALRIKRDSIDNEVRLVLSKASLLTADVAEETKFQAQSSAIDKAIADSMSK